MMVRLWGLRQRTLLDAILDGALWHRGAAFLGGSQGGWHLCNHSTVEVLKSGPSKPGAPGRVCDVLGHGRFGTESLCCRGRRGRRHLQGKRHGGPQAYLGGHKMSTCSRLARIPPCGLPASVASRGGRGSCSFRECYWLRRVDIVA